MTNALFSSAFALFYLANICIHGADDQEYHSQYNDTISSKPNYTLIVTPQKEYVRSSETEQLKNGSTSEQENDFANQVRNKLQSLEHSTPPNLSNVTPLIEIHENPLENHPTNIPLTELVDHHTESIETVFSQKKTSFQNFDDNQSNLFENDELSTNSLKAMAVNITIPVKLGESVNLTCKIEELRTSILQRLDLNQQNYFNKKSFVKLFWSDVLGDNANGIQVVENTNEVTLLISEFRPIHARTYTCQALDNSKNLWIIKNLVLEVLENSTVKPELLENTLPGGTQNFHPYPLSFSLPTTTQRIWLQDVDNHSNVQKETPTITAIQQTSTKGFTQKLFQSEATIDVLGGTALKTTTLISTSKTFKIPSQSATSWLPSQEALFSSTDSIDNTSKDAIASKKSVLEDVPSAADDNSEALTAEEPAKSEEQKASMEVEKENSASGVAIGVALAVLLAAVATTLVLYRRRKNGKKSTYITFGNPSYSRENLPANDYGLDSPLTLSSNGYTVLA